MQMETIILWKILDGSLLQTVRNEYAHKYTNTKNCQLKSFFCRKNSKYSNRMQKKLNE